MRRFNKGVFIVFEGIDGSGKSVQSRKTISWLTGRGFEVTGLVEPTHGEWGARIRKVLSGEVDPVSPEEELDLFIRDRRDNVLHSVLPAIEAGKIIVQDRYYYSTLAYQGARGFSLQEIREKHGAFLIEPDLVFIFDVSPEEGIRRIKDTRKSELSIFEKISYLAAVKKIYDSFSNSHIIHVDASRDPETVHGEVVERIESVLLWL